MISDYIILYGQIKNLAIKHLEKFGQNESSSFINELKNILNITQAKSRKRGVTNKDNANNNTTRRYKDLIEGRFDLAKVIYIDRKDDGSTIFGKAAEFSTRTINQLRNEGYKEALKVIGKSCQ